MTVTVADGPLGLEATHHWNGGAAILNDHGIAPGNGRGNMPYVLLDRITGLHALPDADDNRSARTSRMGEVVLPGYPRGKTLAYEGRIRGSTLQELRAITAATRGAFSERNTEGEMQIVPDAAYGSVAWSYRARVLQCDVDEQQTRGNSAQPTPWERALTIGLRMSDPRFYLVGTEGVSGQADGATASVTNQGTAPTDPVLSGDPTGATVTLENLSVTTSNGTARLRFTDLPTADLLTVDFAQRSATLTIGALVADAMPYFDASYSQWWDEFIPGLAPGANSLKATGLTGWACEFSSASW